MLPPGFTLLALRLGVIVRGMVVNFLDVLALMVPSYNSVLKVNDALTVLVPSVLCPTVTVLEYTSVFVFAGILWLKE
ncbi:hypothetical protein NGUA07_03378 [Salmonella enterica]|nr:hypothetical protein NGUA07_03378 [Salmonella enterica]